MATQIFSPPDTIKVPSLDFKNIDKYPKQCEKYTADLKKILQEHNPKGKNVGEIIRFPVADGNAEYMVLNMRPLQLVHLPLGDAWEFAHADLLTPKAVQDKIDQQKRMDKLFGRKR